MSVQDQIATLLSEVKDAYRQLVTMEVKYEALDKEVHRTLSEMRDTIREFDRTQRDMEDRVSKLEAHFQSTYAQAVLNTAERKIDEIVAKQLASRIDLPTGRPEIPRIPSSNRDTER